MRAIPVLQSTNRQIRAHMRLRRCQVAVTAILVIFGGCQRARDPKPVIPSAPAATTTIFQALDSPAMQFLPRQEEVPGWRLESDPLVIPANGLASHLSSDALHFQRYEVIDMTLGTYTSTVGQGFASVEIFRFPDFVKAFGAYSSRRQAVSGFVEIANEAFTGPRSVHFWRGPFYVRILGGGSSEVTESLLRLARAVAQGMPVAPGKPAVFGFFPEQNRGPNSEVYSATPVFGQPFLRGAFTAEFLLGGQKIEGMILPATSKPAAGQILDLYRNFFVANGRVLDSVPNLGEGNFTAEDRFFGRTVAFRIDRFVIVMRGFGDRERLIELAIFTDQRILGSIRKQLQLEETAAEPVANTSTQEPGWMQQR